MKSLILTILYLFKDTIYRWKERPASPLARIFVAFFLSLCALSFLANYVLQTKMIQTEIKKTGGDLILINDFTSETNPGYHNLISEIIPSIYDCTVYSFKNSPATAALVKGKSINILEYDIRTSGRLSDILPLKEHPKILITTKDTPAEIQPGPNEMEIAETTFDIYAMQAPEEGLLSKVLFSGGILIPLNSTDIVSNRDSWRYIIQVHEMTAENIRNITNTIANYIRLDNSIPFIQSSLSILKKMDLLLSNQAECRAGFSIGIAFIVGILLTALASMEFRQNEYVYTLMKSFGVRPIFLVLSFIAENIFLVGAAFVGAIYAFLELQTIVLGEFFKLKDATLTFNEIQSDMTLLGLSLLVCVLVSSIPIAFSAYRPIGKVLK